MKNLIVFISLTAIPFGAYSLDFKIGIFRNVQVKKVALKVSESTYILKSSKKILKNKISSKTDIVVNYSSGKLSLTLDGKFIGNFDTLKLSNLESDTGILSINSQIPSLRNRSYYDDLLVFTQKSSLSLVNVVDFEKYIIGVLESEVGKGKSKDFYKVHAIISRTYALKNQYKFIHEGFYLTDLVNCQVYKGNMYKDSNIINAVHETENLILVDDNMDYITASYFSNSGGQTNNVEDV